MPSRIIKESITTSESLSEVSADAERLFWRLVVKADDFALDPKNPRVEVTIEEYEGGKQNGSKRKN